MREKCNFHFTYFSILYFFLLLCRKLHSQCLRVRVFDRGLYNLWYSMVENIHTVNHANLRFHRCKVRCGNNTNSMKRKKYGKIYVLCPFAKVHLNAGIYELNAIDQFRLSNYRFCVFMW